MTAKRERRRLDGVLLLDKPAGITSQGAVSRAKNLLGAAKTGHTGTLDPMATGLLPLAFGEATKFSHALLDADKAYVADVRLGVTTTTGDLEGEVTATLPVNVERPPGASQGARRGNAGGLVEQEDAIRGRAGSHQAG